jgi:hypothetical protein
MVIVPKQKRLTTYCFMDNENIEPQVEPEKVVVEEPTEETPEDDSVVLSKADYNKLNRKAIAYETIKNKPPIINQVNPVDSIDQIKLGKKLHDYSDEELDFVTEAAGSKDPTKVLKTLENPYIQAGIKAIREKVEKENLTLKPNGTQPDFDRPQSLEERLENAKSDKEREEILGEMGLYQEPRRRPDIVNVRI